MAPCLTIIGFQLRTFGTVPANHRDRACPWPERWACHLTGVQRPAKRHAAMIRQSRHQFCLPSQIQGSCGYGPESVQKRRQRTALHIVTEQSTRAHLTTKVLNLDRAAFESHREAALELIFGSAELFWGYGTIQQKCKLVYEVRKN